MHRSPQGLPDVFVLWQFGIAEVGGVMARTTKDDQPGGRVSSEALDEERHGDDEADSHEEHSVPVGLGGEGWGPIGLLIIQ